MTEENKALLGKVTVELCNGFKLKNNDRLVQICVEAPESSIQQVWEFNSDVRPTEKQVPALKVAEFTSVSLKMTFSNDQIAYWSVGDIV